MDWVTPSLAIGNWQDASDAESLAAAGIETVLQLYGPDPAPQACAVGGEFLQLAIVDARPLPTGPLGEGVRFIRRHLRAGRKVLVCCGAGMSRSPTFVAAYLHEEGMDLTAAYRLIQDRRRGILPHLELVRSLVEHYGAPVTAPEVLAALVKGKEAAPVDWVTERIAIGSMADALDHQRLAAEGVEAALQLYGHPREKVAFALPIEVLQLCVEDRRPLPEGSLREGVAFIRRQQVAGRRVLVCCGAGWSRSPVFTAAYLHEEGMPLDEAFRLIRAARPQVRPHRHLLASLVEIYGCTTPLAYDETGVAPAPSEPPTGASSSEPPDGEGVRG
jgi:protein-tyrosine phosphatase